MISNYEKDKSSINIDSLSLASVFFPNSEEPFYFKDIRRRVFFYRNIFLMLGIVFLCLTKILFFHTPNWNFKLLFGHGTSFKLLLTFLSASLGIASLWLGCSMRVAIEAIYENARKAKRKLKKLYLASSLSVTDKQKYQLLKEEIEHLNRKTIYEHENLEKKDISAKAKQAITLQILEKQKQSLIQTIQDFRP